MANQVVQKEDQFPTDLLDELTATAGEGTTFESSELQIPFIRIIQALSPQIKRKDPLFIEGADQGDAFNTVTNQFWNGEDGLTVIPCYQETKYLEFVPRETGGGFVGELSTKDPMIQKTERKGAREILPNGNDLVKSDQHYCLIVEGDGMIQPAIVDMKASQLKVSQRWKTQISMLKIKNPKTNQLMTPALFATQWKLVTVEESNDKGTWYNWSVTKDDLVQSKEIFDQAKKFRQSIMDGAVKAVDETGISDEIPI